MKKIIAIICEYNPFHNGHKSQIDKVKELFPDSVIVAIMSGNITQRGEFSLFDKYDRAHSAVLNGVNAVFELPYPFSASNAEIFAFAGVTIADKIGADYLCFGSESNNVDNLIDIADIINSSAFDEEIKKQLENKSNSFICAKEKALKRLGKELPKTSNDMLAVEYLRAIKAINSKILPIAIKREGAEYNDTSVCEIMSAGAIRKCFYKYNRLLSVPATAMEIFEQQIKNGIYLDKEKADDFLFRYALISSPETIENCFDAPTGCGYYISELSKNSEGYKKFFEGLSSKTYTHSRLRRIVMYLVTGVKSIDTKAVYTTLLSCDDIGRKLIKGIRKKENITILTKQSDAKKLNEKEKELFEISKKADELYYSLLSSSIRASDAYRKAPIII